MQHFTSQGLKDFETPHELTNAEKDYGQTVKNAIEAGFDGMELHAANGYLPTNFSRKLINAQTNMAEALKTAVALF